jgi:hypothetical protein
LIVWTKESRICSSVNLSINYCFCLHQFTFSKHLLFWYLAMCHDNNNYVN